MTATADLDVPRHDAGHPASQPSSPATSSGAHDSPRPSWVTRVVRGRDDDPAWVRPALLGLLGVTALLYLWDLAASGWANAFYAAAVQAGTQSWEAFFFGSSDAGNSITVDKTPLSLWPMVIAARIFGMNSWSLLVPQALMGVASVGLLYATVRRWFTPAAGLIAGAVLALTPVATLMFRFDNPDALLVLLLIGSVYATVRALENASGRWLALAGVLVGLGFMTKMLQALLVVPALAVVYLVLAPTGLGKRIVHLLGALAGLVVAGGWWVAIVSLIPADSRPYIGGSQTNSVLELALGYNGLGRLTGNETGSVGGGRGWGQTGILRLFTGEVGGQIAWLLPAAVVLLAAGLWFTRRMPRTDRTRAAFLLWGLWLLVTGLTFSFMAGIFHAYYTVALAPAIGALVGMGAALLWQQRRGLLARVILAATTAGSAVWAYVLLGQATTDTYPVVRAVVILVGLAAALGLLVVNVLPAKVGALVAVGGLLAVLAGPATWSVQTATTAHTGSIPSAGPRVAGAGFGGPGAGGQRGPGGFTGAFPGGQPNGTAANGMGQNGMGQNGMGQKGMGQNGFGGTGGVGGLLNAGTPSAALVTALQTDASSYRWAAAAIGSNSAAGLQLASGEAVMPIGGFNGSDPSPTLEEFKAYVAAGQIHYFIGGSGMRSDSGSSASQEIAAWVQQNYTATTVGGTTVYDLTQPTSGSASSSGTVVS